MQGGVVCGGGGEQAADGTPAGGRTHNQRNIIVPVIPSYRFRDSYKRSLAHSSSPTSSSTPRRLSSVIHPFAAHTSDVFFLFFTNLAFSFHFCLSVIVAAGAPSFTSCCTHQAQDSLHLSRHLGKRCGQ